MTVKQRLFVGLLGVSACLSAVWILMPRADFRELPAYRVLLKASDFECDDDRNLAVVAFRELLVDPQADRAFKALLSEATLPGQLYALCGLYHTDQVAFRREVERYRRGTETIYGNWEVKTLVEDPSYDTIRLAPGETLSGWRAARNLSDDVELPMDIIGGALPMRLRGEAGYTDSISGLGLEDDERLLEVLRDEDTHPEIDLPRQKRVVPGLVRLLEHEDPKVRARAVGALGGLSNLAAEAAPAMAEMLRDDDEVVRDEAGRALSRLGPWAEAALPELRRTLLVPTVARSAKEGSEVWLFWAVGAVRFIGGPTSRQLLEELLKHPDAYRRSLAAFQLRSLEREGALSVPALLRTTNDADYEVRLMVLLALGRLGAGVEGVDGVVQEALNDPEPIVRAGAARALWQLKRDAKRALPNLLGGLDTDVFVLAILQTRSAIREVLDEYPEGVSLLADYVRDKTKKNRQVAIEIAAQLGDKARGAEAALRSALDDSDARTRLAAATALFAVAGDTGPVLDMVRARLSGGRTEDIALGLADLPALGPSAAGMVPELLGCLSHGDATVRETAATALGAIGKKSKAAVSRLREMLADDEEPEAVRWAAYKALSAIAFRTEDRVAALAEFGRSGDPSLRRRAFAALVDEGAAALVSIEVLEAIALEDPSPEDRWRAGMAAKAIRDLAGGQRFPQLDNDSQLTGAAKKEGPYRKDS